MEFTHTTRVQLRGLSRCALAAVLAGMLASPTFALSTPTVNHNEDTSATIPASSTTLETTAEAPDSLPLIATNNNSDAEELPEAPAAPLAESASLLAPAKADLLAVAEDSGSSTTSTSTTKKHHVRAGFLALGIVGAAAAGMGAYIFSIKTTSTGARDALGTMFLAPGAAAAGLGFYFAFK